MKNKQKRVNNVIGTTNECGSFGEEIKATKITLLTFKQIEIATINSVDSTQ